MKQGKVSIENIRGMGMDIPLLGIRNACHEVRLFKFKKDIN